MCSFFPLWKVSEKEKKYIECIFITALPLSNLLYDLGPWFSHLWLGTRNPISADSWEVPRLWAEPYGNSQTPACERGVVVLVWLGTAFWPWTPVLTLPLPSRVRVCHVWERGHRGESVWNSLPWNQQQNGEGGLDRSVEPLLRAHSCAERRLKQLLSFALIGYPAEEATRKH